jgi:hypothetical protein
MPVQSFYGPDNEAQFDNWRTLNPQGFFINSEATPSERYLVLHRTTCSSIDTGRRTTYRKTCAVSIEELRQWLEEHGLDRGAVSSRCPTCAPPTI